MAEQGGERLLEVAHRDAAQVEDRQQRIQAARPSCPARQDRRGETDALGTFTGAAVTQFHSSHLDRADPGLDHPLRALAVPDHALPPIRQPCVRHHGQERLGLRFHRLGKQPAGAAPQDDSQRIVDRVGLTERDNSAIARHGVSAPSGVQAGFHPPRYAAFLKPPSPSFAHSSLYHELRQIGRSAP
jgi:hypothetical protein